MAPRAKAVGMASLIECESEPDFDSFDATGYGSLPQKAIKARVRPAPANRVTKTVRKTTRKTTAKAMTSGQMARHALVDKSNAPKASARTGKTTQATRDDDDEITMVDQLEASEQQPPKATRGHPKASKNIKGGGVTSNLTAKSSTTVQGPSAYDPILVDEIPETQATDLVAIDENPGQLADLNEPWMLGPGDRPSDAFAEQDMDDVSIRRQLGELRNKYDSLEMRHRDLRDIGVKVAERNFERLKKQAEQNTAAANKLISQLKEEVAAQSTMVQQAELLRQQLERSESEASALRVKLSDVSDALSGARSEIKTISAKLAASRTAEVNVKVPSNGSKTAVAGNRTAYMETLQAAQSKEDLYGDLTGLIVRDVRRFDKEDVFDCIQTGRNGTLHFKLALEKVHATENYENVQFTYRPQLDASRDSDLMDVLPDYLTEEITFPRPHASKFYTRVTKSLMDRLD